MNTDELDDLIGSQAWGFTMTCPCADCRRVRDFNILYERLRAGAPFESGMLSGLMSREREAIVKLLCQRSI